MRVVSIHQPPYFPWLGLLHKIALSDVFVVLDSAQYGRHAFQNRTLYSTRDGSRYLTLPVHSKGHIDQQLTIREVELVNPQLPRKHFQTLRQRYGKTPGWAMLQEELEDILVVRHYTHLLALNLQTLALTLRTFNLHPQILLASELDVDANKSELVLDLCRAAEADTYLSGQGAKVYLDEQLFTDAGIPVSYQTFQHPIYCQSHSPHNQEFQPGCFALEWFLEDPDGACADLQRLVSQTM